MKGEAVFVRRIGAGPLRARKTPTAVHYRRAGKKSIAEIARELTLDYVRPRRSARWAPSGSR
jgi:hypothetical protein